jgi:hypothetical protein
VVKLVEAGCAWPHGKTARGVAGGDVVKWICNITTNKVCVYCLAFGGRGRARLGRVPGLLLVGRQDTKQA